MNTHHEQSLENLYENYQDLTKVLSDMQERSGKKYKHWI